jgi:hypothetical protein
MTDTLKAELNFIALESTIVNQMFLSKEKQGVTARFAFVTLIMWLTSIS